MRRRDLAGEPKVLLLAGAIIGVVLLLGWWSYSAANPESGSTGRTGIQEITPDGKPGRRWVWYWPWENPDRVGAAAPTATVRAERPGGLSGLFGRWETPSPGAGPAAPSE